MAGLQILVLRVLVRIQLGQRKSAKKALYDSVEGFFLLAVFPFFFKKSSV
jgi:hypothetical protein